MSKIQGKTESWKTVIYDLCIRQAKLNGGIVQAFSHNEIAKYIYGEIKERTNFQTKKPEIAVQKTLRELCKDGKISVIDSTLYILSLNKDSTLKYPQKKVGKSKQSTDSKGEREVLKVLERLREKYNIIGDIEREKMFDGLKSDSHLRFDFYFRTKNHLEYVIEFDGEQHFRPIGRFGGKEGYEETRKRDNIKNNWCYVRGVRLLRIPYYRFDDVEDMVDDFLQNPNRYRKEDWTSACDTCNRNIYCGGTCHECQVENCRSIMCGGCKSSLRKEVCEECKAMLCAGCWYTYGKCAECCSTDTFSEHDTPYCPSDQEDISSDGDFISDLEEDEVDSDVEITNEIIRNIDFDICKVVKIGGMYVENVEPRSIKVRRIFEKGALYKYAMDFTCGDGIPRTYQGTLENVALFFNQMQIFFNHTRMWMKTPSATLTFNPNAHNQIRADGKLCTIYDDNGFFRPMLWSEDGISYLKVRKSGSGSLLKTLAFVDADERDAFFTEIMANIDYGFKPRTRSLRAKASSSGTIH